MWKKVFIVFFLGFVSYAYSQESLTEDVAMTDQSLQAEPNFEDRVRIINEFVEKASQRREKLIKQRRRTDEEILVLFHINILRSFHNELDTSSSSNCTRSLGNAKATLYPNRFQEVMLPFEQSIYNVYKKTCAL